METLNIDEVVSLLENDKLNYTQFYDSEIEYASYYSNKHYLQFDHDTLNIDQKLKIGFIDIEVYKCDLEKLRTKKQSSGPVNCIAYYDSKTKYYYTFVNLMITKNAKLIDYNNPIEYENYFKKELLRQEYLKEDENVKLFIYIDNELEMLQNLWKIIHHIDPTILTGFNSDGFDFPYLYYRLLELYHGDEDLVHKLISKFGVVRTRDFYNNAPLHIAEYPICDLRKLYVPRDEGGLNYGKKQANYSLDWIAFQELNKHKIEYNESGMGLDQLYETDPVKFIMYNIADTALTVRLNDKMKIIELHNMLRRDMKTPFSFSLIGASSLFTSMFKYELKQRKLGMRWGLLQESTHSLDENVLNNIERPKEKNVKWNITKIDGNTYKKIISRYVGAYVKEGIGKIFTLKDGILVDMDATALYP